MHVLIDLNQKVMAFLKPKPIERKSRTKMRPNCDKSATNGSIFDRIRDLCRTPNPMVTSLDERLFVSTIFDDIKELCRRPELLTPIVDPLVTDEEVKSEETTETRVFEKRKKQYYIESIESKRCETNSFDLLNKSKLFLTLVRHKPTKSVDISVQNDIKPKTNCNKKRTTVKIQRKSLKPILSIDCDISLKISDYSKHYSKPKLKKRSNNRKTKKCSKGSEESTNSESIPMTECLYESMASPAMSTTNTMTYSMPATPISSTDSSVSQWSLTSVDTSSAQSFLSQMRKSLNPKFETYGQYIERCVQNKIKEKKCKRNRKPKIDFNQKVLEWKANRICSGNTTPIHNIEYLVTPPGSPQPIESIDTNGSNDELNKMIDSLENEHFVDFNDNINNQFNSLLSDLYSDLMTDTPTEPPIL